jgi:hypothetical protein
MRCTLWQGEDGSGGCDFFCAIPLVDMAVSVGQQGLRALALDPSVRATPKESVMSLKIIRNTEK